MVKRRMRRACGGCRALGADFCNHDGPCGPQRPADVTPWWARPFVIIRRLDDLGGPMCEAKASGVVPSFLVGRGQRKPAPCACHQAPALSLGERFDQATKTANRFLG